MFNHSIVVPERAIAADSVESYDLPCNPLSVILINLRPLNATGTLSNFETYRGIAAALNRISVLYRGESIIGMRGEDAAALAYFRHNIVSYQGMNLDTTAFKRSVTIPILMGRTPFDGSSCFPKTKRGDLTLELDYDVADTGYDTMRVSVECIELLDAKPKEFEKKVQVTQTFSATGDADMQLPLGGDCRGLLLFGTTPYTGAAPAPTWGRIRTLLDNREVGFTSTDWETAQMLHSLFGRQVPTMGEFITRTVVAATGATELPSTGKPSAMGRAFQQYAWLDFDPNYDDKHTISTAGKDFRIRASVETADAVRVVPIEVMPASIIRND